MKTNTVKRIVKDNEVHYTHLTLKMSDDKNGFDLKVETSWTGKVTKDDKEGMFHVEAKNMSKMGLDMFIAFVQSVLGGENLQQIVDSMIV